MSFDAMIKAERRQLAANPPQCIFVSGGSGIDERRSADDKMFPPIVNSRKHFHELMSLKTREYRQRKARDRSWIDNDCIDHFCLHQANKLTVEGHSRGR